MNQLDILVSNRDAILLAEAIGWLHDYRKCSHDPNQRPPRKQLAEELAKCGFSCILSCSNLFKLNFSTCHVEVEILEKLLDDHQWLSDDKLKPDKNSASLLLQLLSRCHNTPHFDKQEPVGGEQDHNDVKIGSAFGFEKDIPHDLTTHLWKLPWKTLASYSKNNRQNLSQKVSKLFIQISADTRRPINEISLWDWGTLVGTLYKATIAGALLSGNIPHARDLRWRLLSIRVQGLDYITKVARLPDLLSRQKLLKDSFDKVRDLLETEYPLGNEVYRDESRSIFVVADLPEILNFTNSIGNNLLTLILQKFKQGTLKDDLTLRLGGELTPVIKLDNYPWWGQDPDWQTKIPPLNEIPPIGRIIRETITLPPSSEEIKLFWTKDNVASVCTVCGLRPQGRSDKLFSRKVCDICERRRRDRSQEWATQKAEEPKENIWIDTIWIDEVADTNARLALITGRFDLDDWLSGQLVESLILNPPGSGATKTTKKPSFSRIRRIWETTRQFWQDVQKDLKESLSDSRKRLIIHLDQMPNLGKFHVYELDLGKTVLSVAWYPLQTDGAGGYLISTDNLGYVARQLHAEKVIFTDPATAAIFVEDYIQSQFVNSDRSIKLRDSDAINQGNQNLPINLRVIKTEHQDIAYSTAIPILTEPNTFMAVVPADKSLDVVKAIKTKYEIEMGKVRNRLPLHLGVVYFNRRTPLRSALDAGRQMLSYKSDSQKTWEVHSISKGKLPDDKKELTTGTKQFEKTITLDLTQDKRPITWYVPIKMGDGKTADSWYPYVFLEANSDDMKVNERWVLKSQRPGTTEPCWLVHAGDLKAGDKIYFTPSTFDFEYLDSSARRFDIHYDQNGRRPRKTRPFYLEDLDRLQTLWEILKNLETSQRHQVIYSIEATREMWHGEDQEKPKDDQVFRRFVSDTLANAAWTKDKTDWWQSLKEWRRQLVTVGEKSDQKTVPDELAIANQLINAGVRGELADIADLYMEILKER